MKLGVGLTVLVEEHKNGAMFQRHPHSEKSVG